MEELEKKIKKIVINYITGIWRAKDEVEKEKIRDKYVAKLVRILDYVVLKWIENQLIIGVKGEKEYYATFGEDVEIHTFPSWWKTPKKP